MSYKITKLRVGAVMSAVMLDMLVHGPCTRDELCEGTGLSPNTIRSYLRAWHNKGLIYIAAYSEDTRGRMQVEEWMWGPGMKDAARQPLTQCQLSERWRKKVRDIRINHALTGSRKVLR